MSLNRPDKFNCLSFAAHEAIQEACSTLEADASVRAILIRAEGEHFCTGADLQEITGIMDDAAAVERFMSFGHKTMTRIEESPLPVVVAVQG
ncbi:MAG: enoyl-CoA hydratase/isomerase family protein, partial [Pseudaminobacter sp.]